MARRVLDDITPIKLTSEMLLYFGQSSNQSENHHSEMLLLVVGIQSPNISKIKPPTVMNQPK